MMQIQNIQSNNTTFNAKFQISKSSTKLPDDMIKQIEATAKKIGNDSDIISLQVGDIHKRRVYMPGTKLECDHSFNDGIRKLYVDTKINGEHKQYELSSYSGNLNKNIDKYNIKMVMIQLLDDLQKILPKN